VEKVKRKAKEIVEKLGKVEEESSEEEEQMAD